MAQRISRAKRTLQGRRSTSPATSPSCCACSTSSTRPATRAGHSAGEAIRLARQLTLATEEPRRAGCSRQCSITPASGATRLRGSHRHADRQDPGLWDTREIAEGVRVLQSALALQRRPGRYQVEAAIAALHDDAASAEETDWPQILAWYDDLVALTDDPVDQTPPRCSGARSRSATCSVPPPGCGRPTGCARCSASGIGGTLSAATCTSSAATSCRRHGVHTGCRPSGYDVAERDHLVRQAARARAAEQGRNSRVSLSVFHRPA